MNIFNYHTSGGKDLILEYTRSLEEKEKIKVETLMELIHENGFKALEIIKKRQLRGKIWELKSQKNRYTYVIDDNNMYILSAFRKEKGKTEKKEIEMALERARELGRELGRSFV